MAAGIVQLLAYLVLAAKFATILGLELLQLISSSEDPAGSLLGSRSVPLSPPRSSEPPPAWCLDSAIASVVAPLVLVGLLIYVYLAVAVTALVAAGTDAVVIGTAATPPSCPASSSASAWGWWASNCITVRSRAHRQTGQIHVAGRRGGGRGRGGVVGRRPPGCGGAVAMERQPPGRGGARVLCRRWARHGWPWPASPWPWPPPCCPGGPRCASPRAWRSCATRHPMPVCDWRWSGSSALIAAVISAHGARWIGLVILGRGAPAADGAVCVCHRG